MTRHWLAPLHQLERRIQRSSLDNGIPLISLNSTSEKVFSLQFWYRRGSAHDPPGYEGTAHFLEHMMFRGSTHYPDGQFDRIAEQQGVMANAWTWYDSTVYTYLLQPRALEHIVPMEADRLSSVSFKHNIMEEERDIILNERASHIEQVPSAMLDEFVAQQLPPQHPYRSPVIGCSRSIRQIGASTLRDFHADMLKDGALYIVACGDLNATQIHESLNDSLGSLSLQQSSSAAIVEGSPSPLTQPVITHADISGLVEPRLIMLMVAPRYTDHTAPHVQLLHELLVGGPCPILEEVFEETEPRCVRTELSMHLHAYDSLATITLVPSRADDLEVLRSHVYERLSKRLQKLSADELKQAQQRLILRSLYRLDEPDTVADALGESYLMTDDCSLTANISRLSTLTVDEIRGVAASWINSAQRSLITAT